MRKINVEMLSNPQQNHLGMESNPPISREGATMIGEIWAISDSATGDCVFFTLTGAGTTDGAIKSRPTDDHADHRQPYD